MSKMEYYSELLRVQSIILTAIIDSLAGVYQVLFIRHVEL